MNKLTYDILSQTHDEWDADKREKLELLFKGGLEILKSHNLKKFIHSELQEPAKSYERRLKLASYTEFMSSIVTTYAEACFEKELSVMAQKVTVDGYTSEIKVDPYYKEFALDCNRQGLPFQDYLQKILTTALVHGKGYIAVDFPKADPNVTNRADQVKLGLRNAYLTYVSDDEVTDYDRDPITNRFTMVRLRRCYVKPVSPWAMKSMLVTEFKTWLMVEGQAVYFVHSFEHEPQHKFTDLDEFLLTDQGVTSFKRIPVIEMKLDDQLVIGYRIANKCIDHFRLSSGTYSFVSKYLFPLPLLKLGDEWAGDGPDGESYNATQSDELRGKVAIGAIQRHETVELGSDDDFSYVAPPMDGVEAIQQERKDIADQIYRLCHLQSQATSSNGAQPRLSAASKQEDNRQQATQLEGYGSICRRVAVEVYKTISEARDEEIPWVATGLDNYEIIDPETLLQQSQALSTMTPHSKTAAILMESKVTLANLGVIGFENEQKIIAEITEGIMAEPSHQEKMEQERQAMNQMSQDEDE